MAVGGWPKYGYNLDKYLAYNFSTTYRIPNLGGYDPLIGFDQANFGLELNLPNVYYRAITVDARKVLDERCVRLLSPRYVVTQRSRDIEA